MRSARCCGAKVSTPRYWLRGGGAIRKGLSPQKRGPKPQTSPEALENQKLQRENERLTEHLRKAQIVIDIQKKVAALLGQALPETETL